MKLNRAHLLALFLLMVFSGCGGGSDPTRNIDFIPLSSIEITSQNPQAVAGTNNQFSAIGHYGGPSTLQFTKDITSQVSWTSSDPAVLTFSTNPGSAGFATTSGSGTVTVTATLNALHTDLLFTVSDATITSLVIPPPASTSLFAGENLQLRANGTFTDLSTQDLTETVAWSSSAPSVATVTTTAPGSGLVKALAQGTSDISAAFGALSATQTITVAAATLSSLEVTSVGESSTLALGTSMQLIATGTYSDGSTSVLTSQVTWTSSDLAVAAIDQELGTNGKLSTVGTGLTTVTATLGGITSLGFQVTVSSATLTTLSISPTNQTISVDQTLQLVATGDFSDGTSQDVTRDVLWGSGDTSIAKVSLSTGFEGTVTGVGAGTVTIAANSDNIPTITGIAIVASDEVTVQ